MLPSNLQIFGRVSRNRQNLCDGSGWDRFGPLLLSELLEGRFCFGNERSGCCWLSTGMNKRLLPCVFEGVEQAFDDLEFDSCHLNEIVRYRGEVDQIDER